MAATNIARVQREGLLLEIARLEKGIKGVKLAQDKQIKGIKDELKHDTKMRIVQSVEYVIPGCVVPHSLNF